MIHNININFLTTSYPTAALCYAVIAVIVFAILFFLNVPYGRHQRPGWGPSMRAVPGWVIMELPALLMPTLILIVSGQSLTLVTGLFFVMWHIHYLHRTFIYTWRRRHYRKTFPVLICVLSFVFNLINGYIVSWDLYVINPISDLSWLSSPMFLLGAVVFAVGMWINISSDQILFHLRSADKAGVEERYLIPNRGLHRWIASPNYFGEILEWVGFAIATFSLGSGLFVLFTIANLAPRAIGHLRWYRRTFADYPSERKALIPGLL